VLVLDLLGHGRSDPPGRARMTVGAHAERLAGLLDVMGVGVASFVGHGMGAAICASLAHTHPARVARLALVNPALLAREPRDARVSGRMTRLAALVPLWKRLAPSWLASTLHAALLPAFAQRSLGAHSLDLYLKGYRTRDGRDAACGQLAAFAASRADGAQALVPNGLSCPVTLALGDADPFMAPAKAARLQAALQEATGGRSVVQRLPSVAHMAPEEAPDRLGAMVGELLTR
jgi:pimeloyl-ACP methyl ester carboxylesterase